MELRLFKTLWGHRGTLDEAVAQCHEQGFDGLEGQAPGMPAERARFRTRLAEAKLQYIAEICTAGGYVPERQAAPARHLESFRRSAGLAMECRPLFLTVIGGCDAWSVAESVDFFGAALAIAREFGVEASFETHRSRSFFNPWMTRDILLQLPELRLTCDFSHWCVVCERFPDTEPDVLALCVERAHHVHGRVGYDQGPQVSHPAAPEYQHAVEAHERWWTQIWRSHLAQGRAATTFTPEFGPDGYLHCLPFTGAPVADLDQINLWMARRQRRRFTEFCPTTRLALGSPVAAAGGRANA